MKCCLDGDNARVLQKAVQSLSKIGSELYVEADQWGLNLRSINSSHSAVGKIHFSTKFFETFKLSGSEDKCKISMKAWLSVFRNMKHVEYCEIRILVEKSKFHVHLKCKLETVKNALISIVDEQSISHDVASNQCSKKISGSYKLFNEISSNFNSLEDEITFEARCGSLIVKNYAERSSVSGKFTRSKLKLRANEFESYEISENTVITFCMKEFRAFLLFAEWLNENIEMTFDDAGKPVFFQIKKLNLIECWLITSTLSANDVSAYDDEQDDSFLNNTENTSIRQKRKNNKHNRSYCKSRIRITEDSTLSNSRNSELFQFHESNSIVTSISRQNDDILVEKPRYLIDRETKFQSENNSLLLEIENKSNHTETQVLYYNTENTENSCDEIDFIPQSPKGNTHVRTIFSRCFQSTFILKEPSPNSHIFAPSSDTEG